MRRLEDAGGRVRGCAAHRASPVGERVSEAFDERCARTPWQTCELCTRPPPPPGDPATLSRAAGAAWGATGRPGRWGHQRRRAGVWGEWRQGFTRELTRAAGSSHFFRSRDRLRATHDERAVLCTPRGTTGKWNTELLLLLPGSQLPPLGPSTHAQSRATLVRGCRQQAAQLASSPAENCVSSL